MIEAATSRHSAVEDLEKASPGITLAAADTPQELEDATAEAIEDRASVIVGGRLPTDHEGRRVGKPDLLVVADRGGYRPVDVKHHLTLAPAEPGHQRTARALFCR